MKHYEIIETVSSYDIKEMFKKCDRDYFSIEAIEAIMDFYEGVGDAPIKFDVIAICCEFTESSPEEFLRSYDKLDDYKMEFGELIDADNVVELMNNFTWCQALNNGNIVYINY